MSHRSWAAILILLVWACGDGDSGPTDLASPVDVGVAQLLAEGPSLRPGAGVGPRSFADVRGGGVLTAEGADGTSPKAGGPTSEGPGRGDAATQGRDAARVRGNGRPRAVATGRFGARLSESIGSAPMPVVMTGQGPSWE